MQFLRDLNEKNQAALGTARINVAAAQEKMKYYYDKRSTKRKLNAEDKSAHFTVYFK